MADNTNNNNTGNNNQFITDYIEVMNLDQMGLLQDIDLQLKSIVRSDGIRLSQSTLKDLMTAEQRNEMIIDRKKKQRAYQNQSGNYRNSDTNASGQQTSSEYTYKRKKDSNYDDLFSFDKRSGKIRAGKMWDQVLDDFEDTLMEGLTGSKNPFDPVFKNLTDQLVKSVGANGVEDLGQQMGKKLLDKLDKVPYTSIFKRKVYDKDGNVVAEGHQRTTIKQEIEAELGTLKGWANTVITKGFNSTTSTLFGGQGVDENFDWFGDLFDFSNNSQTAAAEEESNVEVVAHIDDSTDVIREVCTGGFDRVANSTETLRQTNEQGFRDIVDAVNRNGSQGEQKLGNEFDDPEDIARRARETYENTTGQPDLSVPEPHDYVGDVLSKGKELLGKDSDLPGGAGEAAEGEGASGVLDTLGDAVSDLAGATDGAAGGLVQLATETGAVSEVVGTVGAAFPELLAALGLASVALELISDQVNTVIGPAIEGVQKFFTALKNGFNREITFNSRAIELANKRNEENIKSIREAAYKVIEDSANRVMEVWDRIETTVAATQLADKAGVQDLWSAYASRLKNEGLSSVVSSADIMEKLESVLQQGLQGAVAEEFAYQATLLNSAIPTEDFFQYASTYASIAANAIKSGMSQQEAIDFATSELQSFANNLLYASREVAGGFTTSLKNSAELFEKSADIALTAHQTSTTEISRVLTTISGAVGSIAPDLASNLVDAVYKAAVGGNSSDITALRSMTGVGASNTAFLQALVSNPQEVLSTLFSNLAQLQNMSSANYMEVAEGLSEVFGMSMKEFARVDFNYLASAIDSMSLTSDSLAQNMALLVDGQTTSNDSQMRMQKINEYMIEEGLAYVLDNQVARAIQEHMWEEQLNRELIEAQYSVDFIGGAKSMMAGILNTLKGVLDLINPIAWVKKAANVGLTALEASAEDSDLKQILELGKVGEGNSQEFYNLTTRGKYLGLATPIVELLGGVSAQRTVQDIMTLFDVLSGNLIGDNYNTGGLLGALKDLGNQGGNLLGVAGDRIGEGLDNLKNNISSGISNLFGSNDTSGSAMSEYSQNAATTAATTAASAATSNSVSSTLSRITDAISDSAVATYVSGNAKGVSTAAKGFIDSTVEVNKGILQSGVEAVKATISAAGSVAKGAWGALTGSTDAWEQGLSDAQNAYKTASQKAKDTVNTSIKNAEEIQKQSIEKGREIINNSTEEAKNKLQAETKATTSAIKNAASTLTSASGIMSKTISSLISSGDWRTNTGYNPYYSNFGDSGTDYYTPTQTDAKTLSDVLNESIKKYLDDEKKTATRIENERSKIADNLDDILIERDADKLAEKLAEKDGLRFRSFYTEADLIEMVQNNLDEMEKKGEQTSFEDWLEKFQQETGIKNLAAVLSDYGENIATIEALYTDQETQRQNALTKARDLHEVQFWEDMQNFATVDFPWYMREWERYYIQHEAYTEASNQAYMEAVSLSVAERGEMGDSVLALAEALTENSMWVEEMGDKIKDPVLHTNVLLSKILLTVEAIMQQNNESSIVSVPTALSSLGLGLTNG